MQKQFEQIIKPTDSKGVLMVYEINPTNRLDLVFESLCGACRYQEGKKSGVYKSKADAEYCVGCQADVRKNLIKGQAFNANVITQEIPTSNKPKKADLKSVEALFA
jgi:hypothetical protein